MRLDAAQAALLLGGEGGCWGKCTASLAEQLLLEDGGGGKAHPMRDGLAAVAERLCEYHSTALLL